MTVATPKVALTAIVLLHRKTREVCVGMNYTGLNWDEVTRWIGDKDIQRPVAETEVFFFSGEGSLTLRPGDAEIEVKCLGGSMPLRPGDMIIRTKKELLVLPTAEALQHFEVKGIAPTGQSKRKNKRGAK